MKPTASIYHRVSGPRFQLLKARELHKGSRFLDLTSQNKNSDSKSFPEAVQKQIVICFIHTVCLSIAYFSYLYYIQLNIFSNTLLYLQLFTKKTLLVLSVYTRCLYYMQKNNSGKHPQIRCWILVYTVSVFDIHKISSAMCDSEAQENLGKEQVTLKPF